MTQSILMKLLAIRLSNQNTVAKSLVMLLAILALPPMISGCGNDEQGRKAAETAPGTASDAAKLCASINDTGLAKKCASNSSDNTLDITVGTNDDEEARKKCAVITDKLLQLTGQSSGRWKLQIFSPYRPDKPLASCDLR